MKHDKSSVPGEVRETASAFSERKFQNWLDDAFQDFQKNGGMEDNPYKGKPISIDPTPLGENGALNSILKNAHVLPPWLELQHEIRDDLQRLLTVVDSMPGDQVDAAIENMNQKVRKYNTMCPSPLLQKGPVTRQNLADACQKWS